MMKYSLFFVYICMAVMVGDVFAADVGVVSEEVKPEQSDTQNSKSQDFSSAEDKTELEAFKKLQMENIKLKLQNENNELARKVGLSEADIKLIGIYKSPSGKIVAEVLGKGGGLRAVSVGDHLSDSDGDYIKDIGRDYIVLVSDDGKEHIINLLSPG